MRQISIGKKLSVEQIIEEMREDEKQEEMILKR
jgi:hypothetical protein